MRATTVTGNATISTQNITAGTVPVQCVGPTGQTFWVATITFAAAITLQANQPVTIASATPGSLNGTWTVISASGTSATLNFRGTNPAQWTSGGTLATTAASAYIPLDQAPAPFNVGIGCIVTGTVTYTAQHTFDDVYDPSVNPTWIDQAATGLNGKTATADGNYAFPVRATRVNTTAGTGSVAMTIFQGIGI